MTQKAENRKLILQQLLHKSELFNDYLKNDQNINSILNLTNSKKNQLLQFGKCQIHLPDKVQAPPRKFTSNKIMVLTKNKKQALRIKDKYQNLQKLRQTQILNLDVPESHSERKSISDYTKRQVNTQMRNFPGTRHTQQVHTTFTSSSMAINPESYEFLKEPMACGLSPEQKSNITQLKCKTKEFIGKNRSNSAKVRPQFDFFLKYNNHSQIETGQSIERYAGQESASQRYSFSAQTIKSPNLPNKEKTEIQEQTSPINHEKYSSVTVPQSAHNQYVQDPMVSIEFQPTLPNSPERRSSSFSIKKHPTNINPSLLINKNYQQNLEESKKNKINFRRELHKTYKRAFIPPPKISAKAYAVYEVRQEGIENSGKILSTINGKMAQEVASLTKIMTCIVVLEIADRFRCNLEEETVEIGKFQTNITGTSALLKTGQIYSVQQLLYGLMLPSGNDASLALGVWGGRVLLNNPDTKSQIIPISETNRTHDSSQSSSPLYDPSKKYFKKDYILRFVEEMNEKAQALNMNKTHYANTHGLVNCENKSAAIDIALLCEYVMTNQRFARIVGTRVYESTIKYKEHEPSDSIPTLKPRTIKFQNTHYLLHKKPYQYIGIKTGVTTAAGPCLASYIENKQTGRKFVIVVLDCKSMMMRFKDTEVLKRWLYKQENIPIRGKKFKTRAMSLREDQSEIRSEVEEGECLSDGEDFGEEKCED